MSTIPSVLFVCVNNGGKSQMAAGLMCAAAGDRVQVHSAGTRPGTAVNALSAESLLEVGIDIGAETPKPIDPALLRAVDLVVTLGREAHIDPVEGVQILNWDTDEPSERGIDGMRLVRDDIDTRVQNLRTELTTPPNKQNPQERQAPSLPPTPAHRPCCSLCSRNFGTLAGGSRVLTHLAGDRAVAGPGGSEPGDEINPAAITAMTEVGNGVDFCGQLTTGAIRPGTSPSGAPLPLDAGR